MAYDIERQGDYQILRTTEDRRVLVLDGQSYVMHRAYFTIAEGSQGELEAVNEADVDSLEVLRQGTYKVVVFCEDPQFQDIPYLFLEREGKYDELFIPRGLPGEPGAKVHYIYTDHTIDTDRLEAYLRTGQPSDAEVEVAPSGTEEPPVEDYFDLSAGDLAEYIRQMEPAELRRLEEYEEEHKNRTTVLNTIRHELRSSSRQ